MTLTVESTSVDYQRELFGIPIQKARDTQVGPNKLMGLPYPDSQQICLAEVRSGNGPAAIMDSTCDGSGNFGHLPVYANLLPAQMPLYLLPATNPVIESADFIRAAINRSRVTILAGGEHLGSLYTGKVFEPEDNAEAYGGENQVRDALNIQMLDEVLYNHEKFLLGVCRGFQGIMWGLTGEPPQKLNQYHAPQSGTTAFTRHSVKFATGFFPGEALYGFANVTDTNSNHAMGYTLGQIGDHLDNMINVGWYPLLFDANTRIPPEERVIEGIVRVAPSGEISGLAFQGHFERDETLNGITVRNSTQLIIQHYLH